MSSFAYVENNEIKGIYDKLPKAWKNISGFNYLENDVQKLKEYGWYQIKEQLVNVDSSVGYVARFDYKIETDFVRKTPIVEYYTDEYLIQQRLMQENAFWDSFRNRRNTLLKDSDYTQLVDSQNIKDDTWKNNWKNYRQALRDLPQQYIGTTEFNIDNIAWPVIPNDTNEVSTVNSDVQTPDITT